MPLSIYIIWLVSSIELVTRIHDWYWPCYLWWQYAVITSGMYYRYDWLYCHMIDITNSSMPDWQCWYDQWSWCFSKFQFDGNWDLLWFLSPIIHPSPYHGGTAVEACAEFCVDRFVIIKTKTKFPSNWNYGGESVNPSMERVPEPGTLRNKDFRTWHLIGWRQLVN